MSVNLVTRNVGGSRRRFTGTCPGASPSCHLRPGDVPCSSPAGPSRAAWGPPWSPPPSASPSPAPATACCSSTWPATCPPRSACPSPTAPASTEWLAAGADVPADGLGRIELSAGPGPRPCSPGAGARSARPPGSRRWSPPSTPPPAGGRRLRRARRRASPTGRSSPPGHPLAARDPALLPRPAPGRRPARCARRAWCWSPSPAGRSTGADVEEVVGAPVRAEVRGRPRRGPGRRRRPAGQPPAPQPRARALPPCRLSGADLEDAGPPSPARRRRGRHATPIGVDRALAAGGARCSPAPSAPAVADRVRRPGSSGLGPLEPLLADPAVTEVMVNGPGPVWVERDGCLARTDGGRSTRRPSSTWSSGSSRRSGSGPTARRPLVDARLADGSRVNVALPPLAVDGPYLTIRRFRRPRVTLADGRPAEVDALLVEAGRRPAPTSSWSAVPARARPRCSTRSAAQIPDGRADRHRRGRRRAGPARGPRRPPRGPAGQRRSGRRGRHPGPGAQRPAHAARPHRRRRGPGRREPRPAPGDEHRPRRLAVDLPRQRPGRRRSSAWPRWR